MYDMILKYVFRRYEIIQPTKNVYGVLSVVSVLALPTMFCLA